MDTGSELPSGLASATVTVRDAITTAHQSATTAISGESTLTGPRCGQLVLICSARGGVGKTTIALNVCAALVGLTHSDVLLVDWDLQFGDVSLRLGLNDTVGIGDLVKNGTKLDDEAIRRAIIRTAYGFSVLLPPLSPELGDLVTVDHIRGLLPRLLATHQFVVVDTPVFLGTLNLEWLDRADKIVLVTTPGANALASTRTLIGVLDSIGVTSDRTLVVNGAYGDRGPTNEAMGSEAGLVVAVQLPYDQGAMMKAEKTRTPFVTDDPGSEISRGVNALAARLARPVSAPRNRSKINLISVLIVDDIPSTLDNLQKLLSFEPDIEVVGTATNGKEGIEQTKRLAPDIVLMDINMPIMDGIQATEVLSREMPASRIIAMAVQTERDYLQRALQNGAREALGKPFSGDELAESIRRVHERPAGLKPRPESESYDTSGSQPADLIKVLIVDDIASTRDNLSKLLSFEPDIQIVGTAPDGKVGIEQARNLAPNIVVMGINMPIMDGITATERLSAALPMSRVIAMSVQSAPNYVQRAFQAGAFDFLRKPFSGDELVSSIRFVWKVAKDDELRIFRAAMAKSDAPTVAQIGASLLNGRLVAWRTLVQMRYTFTWADEARMDPQLIESANGTGVEDLIASARLAKEAELRANEATRTALNAWQIARQVVDTAVSPSVICAQYLAAAGSHETAKSAAQQTRETVVKLKTKVPVSGKIPANEIASAKVLIVEGNLVNVRLYQHLLEKHGFEVRQAHSGAECLSELTRELPDIILMEIQLPDEDGLTLTRRLRADSRTANLTIVACTAHAMPGDREKILAAGCDGYIRKPIDPATFARDVAGYLKQRKLKATPARTPDGTPVGIANEPRPTATSPVPSESAEGAQNITDSFDYKGSRFRRASSEDSRTLPRRVIEVVQAIPGFDGNKELGDYMTQAATLYERGDYLEAHRYLTTLLDRLPALRPYVFCYIRRCERVLATPPTMEEKQYEAQVRRYVARPRWLRPLTARPPLKLRCKWCGRYTPYIDPNHPTYGFISEANSCRTCGRMYPMPSWSWDSPDGRAYSYYRHSFTDSAFYEEFERDYDPRPGRSRNGSPAGIANERRQTTIPPSAVPQSAPRAKPTGDPLTTMNERPAAAGARNSLPGGTWRFQGLEKWEAFQTHYRSCLDCLKTGAQTDLCVRGASLLDDALGPEPSDPSQPQDEQLFLDHIHGCRICKQVAGQLAMCEGGKQLSDRWLSPERLVRPRRQAQAMGEAVFGYQLAAHASSRRHQQSVVNVWDQKTYEVSTEPNQGTGAWRARVSSTGGFLKRTQDLFVAPVDGGHTPEDIHARLVAMAQFQRPEEWVVSDKTFREPDDKSQPQPGAGSPESGDPTSEAAIRDELARYGFRPDAQVLTEAARFERCRISPCPECSGPSAMDLHPRQVRFWLRLTLNKESGSYALACDDCGSVEPLPVGMLDWAMRTATNLNKVLGPEVIH